MGVQPGPGSGPADSEPSQPLGRGLDPRRVALHRFGVRAEFLPQADGDGVLQMRAPRFNDVVELDRFFVQRLGQVFQDAQQFVQPPQASETDGGRDGVVCGLRHVDVVVRVDAVLPELSAHDLRGAVGDDFVDVHVVAGPRARLEGVHDELIVPPPGDDFVRGLDDGRGPLVVEQAEVAVDFGGRPFDRRHGPDEGAARPESADREVVHRALGLRAV
ncbi:MAG: hypothetical protein PGMFKBFP_01139 [Anaerolineales bacterium]|nr:hypothetical protein [Anaerolineales bacterium]